MCVVVSYVRRVFRTNCSPSGGIGMVTQGHREIQRDFPKGRATGVCLHVLCTYVQMMGVCLHVLCTYR